MNSHDLTPQQLDELAERIRQMVDYLHHFKERMEQRKFPRDDEIFELTSRAFDRVHHLRMALHYRAVNARRET